MMPAKTTQTFDLSEDDIRTAVVELIERLYGPGGEPRVVVGVRSVLTGRGRSEANAHAVTVSVTREPAPAWQRGPAPSGQRKALQTSADEARADELRLITNHLYASGIPAWREAAVELSALKHRDGPDPT